MAVDSPTAPAALSTAAAIHSLLSDTTKAPPSAFAAAPVMCAVTPGTARTADSSGSDRALINAGKSCELKYRGNAATAALLRTWALRLLLRMLVVSPTAPPSYLNTVTNPELREIILGGAPM